MSIATELMSGQKLEEAIDDASRQVDEIKSSADLIEEQLELLRGQILILVRDNEDLLQRLVNEQDYTLCLQRAVNCRECNCPECGHRVSIGKASL